MPPLAYFGIESSGLNLVIDLLILFIVVLYFALIYWTLADARRRIEDPMLVGCAFVAALFPFVGPIVYMVLRPPEYLEDAHERELETQAAQARVRELEHGLCPHCSYRVESDFLRCPSCLRKLKERCAECSRPLDQAWTICPYCEADVPGIAPARARRRRPAPVIESELDELDGASVSEGADDRDAGANSAPQRACGAPTRPSRPERAGSRPAAELPVGRRRAHWRHAPATVTWNAR